MRVDQVTIGDHAPDEFHAIIEIPANADPVKYELDKDTGALFVDRFLTTAMHYPCNYGYVPQTLCDDGDPLDVLVITPYPLAYGSVVACRPVGVLNMTDEKGGDAKLVALPTRKLCPLYDNVNDIHDLPQITLDQIAHFFEHYKDLEKGKWAKLGGWGDASEARQAVVDSINMYQAK